MLSHTRSAQPPIDQPAPTESASHRSPLDKAEAVPPRVSDSPPGSDDPRLPQVWANIQRCVGFLRQQQAEDGHWCAELIGDSILQSETILLYAFLGRERDPVVQQAARYLLQQQQPHGGWGQYERSAIDISASVKAYFALKVAGHDPQSPPLQRARQAILDAGGADRVNSFTRFFLALLGQIPYEICPAVPPEMVLLPDWSPAGIHRFSAWSRTIFVPLAIVWAHRPRRDLPKGLGIAELFHAEPRRWPPLENPGTEGRLSDRCWVGVFRGVDRLLKLAEKVGFRPLRRRALRVAESWMLERFSDSDGLGAIYPPIVWSLIALRCLGYSDDSPEVVETQRHLDDLQVSGRNSAGEQTLHWQPCKSPVWDTAITLRALAASDSAPVDMLARAAEWLLAREIRVPGDWTNRVDAEPAGWCFEYNNAFYPDIDDTIMVMMALQEVARRKDVRSLDRAGIADACERGRRWVLAMQNRDGGWGAFDRDNDAGWLCHVPFADHNAMIDPSTPDITARVLEALACMRMERDDPPVRRALQYLEQTQEADGSWFGRWGVNHIYGTWQVLVGLRAIGVSPDDPMIRRGADWLQDHQHPSGGWGESANSYLDDRQRGRGEPTASQTSWAIAGLIAAGRVDSVSVSNGLEFLLRTQQPSGRWLESELTGTGFPRVFYLRYDYYSVYFPLLALSQWRRACRSARRLEPAA